MQLAELLKQTTITLKAGDYIVANTAAAGYLPTHKHTVGLKSGRYLFRILDNGGTGKFKIVPVVEGKDGKSYEEKTNSPIVTVEAGKIMYMTTRNEEDFRDVYHVSKPHVVKNITAGQEARHALVAFAAFAKSEYALGVNHFQVVGPDYLPQ
ncbi:Ig domain containing protein [Bacillus phage Moonbeam]|uniref:Uncharacterized protein n=1 Tax=Bacillus phage Moonbeam TaxID=1540091 RepID=A0A0A0RN77_9CAUD|nr:Ig domain containing protein [Bacillus phage Moonbeam]AIW03530.1 hypothetical protein CPT_Moonbeam132 [Bacillus phage Moonbeam]